MSSSIRSSAWQTHEIANQVDELSDYPLFDTDPALQEGLQRNGAAWAFAQMQAYGEQLGRAETYALADAANRHTPELRTFDARGRRIDKVDFHPAWDQLLALYRGQGLVSLSFEETQRPGRWSAFAAGFYLHGQVEAGTLCPATMTQAAIPVLARDPDLAALLPQLRNCMHDPRDLPIGQKNSLWIGMGMTEKQGGSDVRANTTRATPVGGREYSLRGHKWFFSVPMSDAHLVTAQTEAGASCFFVPRWRPDGTKNTVQIQRLKEKIGNRSNSSSEVEFLDAYGVLVGEEGRGIPTIIEMAGYTRLNCVIGSAALIRQALVQALHYTRRRRAFGRTLAEQPLMQSVLVDMALESEAAALLMLRLAQGFENGERGWQRILTPAAKFWVCKRAVELTGEAIEVFGGNGYVDSGVMARLYREAPVNSIWEGSGNVMCLDVLRAFAREPEALLALLDDWRSDAEPALRAEADALQALLGGEPAALEPQARLLCQRLVLLAQAVLLRRHSPAFVADAFIASRLDSGAGRVYGALDIAGFDVSRIWERGEVETRPDNWHDFFNALVWLAFPHTKNAISAAHVRAMQQTGEQRGRVRDALTHFDECGIVVLSARDDLLDLLRNFRWRELFVDQRAAVRRDMRFIVFGHATYEALLAPFRGLTAKALLYPVDDGCLQMPTGELVAAVDQRLAADVAADCLRHPRDLQPLPLLGIPGLTPESEDPAFYEDTWQFRPGRRRPAVAPQASQEGIRMDGARNPLQNFDGGNPNDRERGD